MVVKENQAYTTEWNDPHMWRNKRPREDDIHDQIESRRKRAKTEHTDQGFENTVQSRGSRLMMELERHRQYLKYYPAGTLYHVLRKYFKATDYGTKSPEAPIPAQNESFKKAAASDDDDDVEIGNADSNELPRAIPEEYIWYVLSCLIDALLVLRRGRVEGHEPGWKPITHCDIKLENILMDLDPNKPEVRISHPSSQTSRAQLN